MRTYRIVQDELLEQVTEVVRATLSVEEIGAFIGRALGSVTRALAREGMSPSGPPFARYHRVGAKRFDVEVGFPTQRGVSSSGEVRASSLPAGPAAVMTYVGPYDQMEAAYGALAAWVAHHGGRPFGDPWEIYLSDPAQEPDPEQWRTEIVMPFAR